MAALDGQYTQVQQQVMDIIRQHGNAEGTHVSYIRAELSKRHVSAATVQ